MSLEPPEVSAAIAHLTARARARWPGVELDAAVFARFVLDRCAPSAEPVASLDRLAGEDVYLACAVLAGDPRAMAAFDELLGVADAALARIGGEASFADEVRQRVRIKLLIGEPETENVARLTSYRGEGDLPSFLRVLLVREGLDLRRRGARREHHAEEAAREAATVGAVVDPEVAHLRREYGPRFERAFADAVASLAPAERTLLRYHYVDRLTIDQIGALEHVHRASAARRLTRLRQVLMDETRRLLRERLRLTEGELASVLRILESDLHVSVQRLLG